MLIQLDYHKLTDLRINSRTLPSEDSKRLEASNLNHLWKIWSLPTWRNKRRRTREEELELRSKFCKSMKRNRWSSFTRRTQCSTKSLCISRESLKLWKLKPKLLIVFREKSLILQRKMLFQRMNSKSLTRKREFRLYSSKEKMRKFKEANQMEIKLELRTKKERTTSLLISLKTRLSKITLVLQMTMSKRRRRIYDLRDLVAASSRWSKFKVVNLSLSQEANQVWTTLMKNLNKI